MAHVVIFIEDKDNFIIQSQLVNVMIIGVLATQRARVSAAMVLT